MTVTLRPHRPPTIDEPKFVANLMVHCSPMHATGLIIKRIHSPAGTIIIPRAVTVLPQVGKSVSIGAAVYNLTYSEGRSVRVLRGLAFNYPYLSTDTYSG
jgi:hypothetical protein